ncbi:M48 family metallopeptidase [Kribbella sp. NPDC051952]|uniref:M48 family metallopeptidase n=1 Tax=Kribbella sp. NPDC051952 TaxID=3154851 RepID=UPI003414C72C
MQSAEETTNCPDCGHQIRVNPRYVTWCEHCDWNVDPTPVVDQTPAWRLAIEHRLANSLYGELAKGEVHRPGWDAARIAAVLLSVLILMLPLIGLVTGIALLVLYRPLWFSILLSLPAFGIAFLTRPRAATLPRGVQLLHRDQAPTLYAVLDQVAAAVGTKRVAAVAVIAEPNLWYMRAGWRLDPVIGIGLPLWAGLRPQERVAMLAHELGHGRHGDSLNNWLVGSAWSVLDGLRATFTEHRLDRIRREWGVRDGTGTTIVSRMLNTTVGLLVRGIAWLLERLQLRSSQRAEYLADRKAGEIAGSEATAQALERLFLADASYRAMERAIRFPTEITPLDAVRRAVTEVPAREIERHLRASRVRETRTDATHPPTYLRTKLIRTRPITTARVVLDTDQSLAIDHELEPVAQKVLSQLRLGR